MKKQLLFTVVFFFFLSVGFATVHTVQVANFQFTPATVNAVVGDSIVWTWVSGSHTTTCDPSTETGNSLPDGATTWNSPINSTSKTFTYKFTVAGTYNYWCIPHAPNMAGVVTVTSVLPVVLLNFSATLTSDNKALLKWTIASEQNTNYYTIQKSGDGKTFTDIGQVASAGNSNIQRTYSFTDNNTGNSLFAYYALKTVDKDGTAQLSNIILFKNANAKKNIIISISPNPISSPGHLMLQFNADKEGELTVQLFDMNGRKIKETQMMATVGINNGHFHLGELPAGTYTVVFTMDDKRETKRIQFR